MQTLNQAQKAQFRGCFDDLKRFQDEAWNISNCELFHVHYNVQIATEIDLIALSQQILGMILLRRIL